MAQTIRLRDAKWWSLLPEDPVERLVEHARIADQAVRRTKAAGDMVEMHAMEDRQNHAASTAFAAGASIETMARRIHREAYRVSDWIKAVNDGRLPTRR
ncbi:hypothetical protein [Corynebacterium sp.]|uniref:hypothetical protein n=1 Tax=Corynebacterium sp. TaxID=1720 RepID=UPI003B3B712D